MALNRWLGALLIVTTIGVIGCAEPQKKDTSSTPKPAETTMAQETPEPAETTVADATPAEGETPADGETPAETASSDGPGDVPASGVPDREALEYDFELADGMAGYDEVLEMQVPPMTPELVAQGKELFVENCASCHGEKGMGDGEAGKALDPPPRNMTDPSGYKYGHLHLALYRTGAYGVDGTGMAPWGDILEPDQMWAISHYIREEIQQ